MPRNRVPDGLPYVDLPEEYDGAKVIYIERPQVGNRLSVMLDSIIIAILLGLSAFIWSYTTSMESRVTKLEVRVDYLDRTAK